jgi:hypothetical protein
MAREEHSYRGRSDIVVFALRRGGQRLREHHAGLGR